MAKTREEIDQEWQDDCKAFILGQNFPGPGGMCCMKNPHKMKDGFPIFGFMKKGDMHTIWEGDFNGANLKVGQIYPSLDDLLLDGWRVD